MRKLLRRIPLSLFAAFLGLAAGLALWEIIDATQKNAVRELYNQQLEENLQQRARETLIHFDHSLNSYKTAAQLLASHRRIANYLNPPKQLKTLKRHICICFPADLQDLKSPFAGPVE